MASVFRFEQEEAQYKMLEEDYGSDLEDFWDMYDSDDGFSEEDRARESTKKP